MRRIDAQRPLMRWTDARRSVVRVAVRACGICAALVLDGIRVPMIVAPIGMGSAALVLLEIGRNGLVLGIGLALALELRDLPVFSGHPASRRLAVTLGAMAAVASSVLLATTHEVLGLGIVASEQALHLYLWWYFGMVAIVAVPFLSRRRGSREAKQRHAAMTDRLDQARQRLASIGARTGETWLEPQMIFDCLSRAREAYVTDRARGDAVLSRLAHCLRLTLDIASNIESTLGREADLAAARLDVERDEADSPLTTHVESRAAMARFPPGLLAALTREWVRHPAADAPRALRLHADRDSLALRVRLDGPCPPSDALQRHAAELLGGFAGRRASTRVEARTLHMEIVHA